MLQQMEKIDLDCILIRGLPNCKDTLKSNNVKVINHLPPKELAQHMAQSEFIVCRSGYSTIMDLQALGCSAILVATPGQNEQEYLAKLHSSSMITSEQDKFDLDWLTKNSRERIHNESNAPLVRSMVEETVLTGQPD